MSHHVHPALLCSLMLLGPLTACSVSDGESSASPASADVVTAAPTSNGTPPSDAGDASNSIVSAPSTDSRPVEDKTPAGPWQVFAPLPSDLAEPAAIYSEYGYDVPEVIRIDVRTRAEPGTCNPDDGSGCTLADVLADTNHNDDIKIDIPVHFSATDFADDGNWANAELRQRGGTTRLAPQKSFRIKLDDGDSSWRDETKLQLNKHPYEATRTRNKLSMDLMADIPWLMSFRTQFTNLWIDDGAGPVDYGLFTHIEAPGNGWLKRRGLDKGDNLYKISRFRFSLDDLESLQLDADGKPLDKDRFERVLEIKSGSDHGALVRMLSALHDPSVPFDTVMDTYFNRNNVMAWMVVNVLLHQSDAVSHNLVLHNPKGSDRFYFVPWDYDGTFVYEKEPANATDNAALRQRLRYGFARNAGNDFTARWLAQPGVHGRMLEAATILRRDWLTDARIAEHAEALSQLANPFQLRAPDSIHNTTWYERSFDGFAPSVAQNEAALRSAYAIPLPPTLGEPQITAGGVAFSWTPALEVTGRPLGYELLIASQPDFADESVQVFASGIAGSERSLTIDAARIGSGMRYARLIARVEGEPDRFWQVSRNTMRTSTGTLYGVLPFSID